jgi:succinyl-CoA synthetase beta subunit
MINTYTEKEAEDFLEENGFPVVERFYVSSLRELRESAMKLGYPVVIKNTKLLHKTEKGGVRAGVTIESLEKEYQLLGVKRVLVQKQLTGIEFLVGLKRDAVFGQVLVCGLGGIFAELFQDVSFRVCPISRNDAVKMIEELKSHKLFEGFRNIKYSRASLVSILMQLSDLARKFPEIQELDLNPFIVDKTRGIVVDARIVFDGKVDIQRKF